MGQPLQFAGGGCFCISYSVGIVYYTNICVVYTNMCVPYLQSLLLTKQLSFSQNGEGCRAACSQKGFLIPSVACDKTILVDFWVQNNMTLSVCVHNLQRREEKFLGGI